MKKSVLISILVLCLYLLSCERDLPYEPNMPVTDVDLHTKLDGQLDSLMDIHSNSLGRSFYQLPQSSNYGQIPQDPQNPLTAAKVELGKLLFHDPGLATNPFESQGLNTYSCSSCHHAAAGFQSGLFQAIGEGGEGFGSAGEGRFRSKMYNDDLQVDVQPIRTPSVMNIAYQDVVLYGGRMGGTGINEPYRDLWQWTTAPEHFNTIGLLGVETQAVGGLQIHRMEIDSDFVNNTSYKAKFDEVFPEFLPIDRYEKFTAGLAIAAYQRTILANEAPFQHWVSGESDAMSIGEKDGAILFFGKAGCVNCHNGPNLANMEFHALGMKDLNHLNIIDSDPPSGANMNLGRGDFTQNPDEYYQFKVPQLYNLADVSFLGHGSSFNSVKEVIEYKNNGVSENDNVGSSHLSELFVPLNLSNAEINQLTMFVEQALRDPNLERYVPTELPSGFCFPNNDAISRADLGCM